MVGLFLKESRMLLIRRYLEIVVPIWARRLGRSDSLEALIKRDAPQPVRPRELKLPGVRAAFKPTPKNLDYSSHS